MPSSDERTSAAAMRHVPDLAIPDGHPLAGREAYQCDSCQGIFYPDPCEPLACPYCAEESLEAERDQHEVVTLDGRTFAALAGREREDVYLFRVSEAFIDAMGDNEWHGPVEWRIVREPGVFVTLQMRDTKPVDYAFADALLALSELGHDDAVERLRRRWADVVTA